MKKLVLIDGNSLINRAFYATPVLTAPDGRYTNAVYAFVNMLIKLIGDVKPDRILVAFDVHAPTFRHKTFSEYKGTRKPMPEELRPQIDLLKEVLDVLGIARYECAGIEADDIIGTLAKKYDCETIVITGDKDSFQLVDESTSVYFTRRGITDIEIFNAANFKEKTGIEPIQIIDLKALMGDSSDNIPGVAGVGEKTGSELVQTYGDIDNLYAHIDDIKGKLKEKLIAGKESAYLSKYLATIRLDVDVPLSESEMAFSYPFPAQAKSEFLKLDFKNILKKNGVFSEGDNIGAPSIPQNDIKKIVVSSENEITPFIKSGKFAVSIGDYFGFYNYNETEVELKIQQNFFDEGFSFDQAIRVFKPIFENEENVVLVYGLKSTLHLLSDHGIEPKCRFEDLSLIKYLIDYTGKDEDIKDVLKIYDLDDKKVSYSISVLFETLYNKASEDEKRLYRDVELPLSFVLFEMERSAFPSISIP